MTRRSRSVTAPPKERTLILVSLAEAEAALRERIDKGNAILASPITDKAALEQARGQYYTWDEYNTALLRRIFTSDELAQEYSYWGIAVFGGRTSFTEELSDFHDDVSKKLRRLESVIERLPLYTTAEALNRETRMPSPSNKESPISRTVFLVHGSNNELKETVARFLTQLELVPVILHEQASGGRTIIEKFEAHADACFTIVLLMPDDVGRIAANTKAALQARARQNVIFEWGFFVAKLGRRNVCALYAEGVELPSDVSGVVYVELDRMGAWKLLLARELKAGGVDVDLNRAI